MLRSVRKIEMPASLHLPSTRELSSMRLSYSHVLTEPTGFRNRISQPIDSVVVKIASSPRFLDL